MIYEIFLRTWRYDSTGFINVLLWVLIITFECILIYLICSTDSSSTVRLPSRASPQTLRLIFFIIQFFYYAFLLLFWYQNLMFFYRNTSFMLLLSRWLHLSGKFGLSKLSFMSGVFACWGFSGLIQFDYLISKDVFHVLFIIS